MESLRFGLQIGALAVLVLGPIAALVRGYQRSHGPPSGPAYLLRSVGVCTALFWSLRALAEVVLALHFAEVVPDGSWTELHEAGWTEAERRVVDRSFADGARNVFTLFAPIPLALYCLALWTGACLVHRVFDKRRDRPYSEGH